MKILIRSLPLFIVSQSLFIAIINLLNSSLNYDIFNHLSSTLFETSLIFFFAAFMLLNYKVTKGIVAALLTFVFFINITVFQYFGDFLGHHHLVTILNNPVYIKSTLRDYVLLNPVFYPAFIIIFLIFFFLLSFIGKLKFKRVNAIASIIVLLISFKLTTYNDLNKQIMPLASSALATYKALRKGITVDKLYMKKRARVSEKHKRSLPFHTFIIIHESWAKNENKLFGGEYDTTPCLTKELNSNSDYVKFDKAFTNSSATDVSLPSIVTGLLPTRSLTDFVSRPFIWDYFAGPSSHFTSQDLTWANLRNYYNSSPPNKLYDAISSKHPIVHDIGIDDHNLFKDLFSFVKTSKKKTFNVVFTNSIHAPFQTSSNFIVGPIDFPRADLKATYIADHAFCQFIDDLKSENIYDDSLIIITSDHGDTLNPQHKIGRITSYYSEIINTPFVIKTPKAKNKKIDMIIKNKDFPISNIDIFPTILDLQGIEYKKFNLDGQPLTRKIQEQRPIISLSTNEFRTWQHLGFSIVIWPKKLIVSTINKFEIFNLENDPNETQNLFNNKEQLKPFLKTINNHSELQKIFIVVDSN